MSQILLSDGTLVLVAFVGLALTSLAIDRDLAARA